jgi:uncharacterized membrane protein
MTTRFNRKRPKRAAKQQEIGWTVVLAVGALALLLAFVLTRLVG